MSMCYHLALLFFWGGGYVKLGPDYSGSGLWLVRMWTGSRVQIQATRDTGTCGSECCRYIKGRLASCKGRGYVQLR